MGGTVHTNRFNHMKRTQVGKVIPVAVTDWHTYAIEWSANGISFIVDGQEYHNFPNDSKGTWETWPFDRHFHLILNLAVGGSWGGRKGVDENAFRNRGQIMEVSSVRIYQLK